MGKGKAGFSFAEMLIAMMIVCVVVAASLPFITLRKTLFGTHQNSDACIVEEGGNTLSAACQQAIVDCEYNRGNSCASVIFLASNPTYADTAKNVLKEACTQGSKKACDYFIEKCAENAANCSIDGTNNNNDLRHFLAINANDTGKGKSYIYTAVKKWFTDDIPNIVTEVKDACSANADSIACKMMSQKIYNFNRFERSNFVEENAITGTTFNNGVLSLLPQFVGGADGAPPDPDNNHDYEICAAPEVATLTKAVTGLNYDIKFTKCNVALNPVFVSENPGGSPTSGCWYGTARGVLNWGCQWESGGCGNNLGDLGGSTYEETDMFFCTHDKAVEACDALNNGVDYGEGCGTAAGCHPSTKGWRLPTTVEQWKLRYDYDDWAWTYIKATIIDTTLMCGGNAIDEIGCGIYANCAGSNDGNCHPQTYWSSTANGSNFYLNWYSSHYWYTGVDSTDAAYSTRCVRSIDPPEYVEPPNPDASHSSDYKICASPTITTLTKDVTGLPYDLKMTNCNVATAGVQANNFNQSSGCWYGNGTDGVNCSGTGCGADKFLCTHDAAVQACEALNLGVNYGQGCEGASGCDVSTYGWRLPKVDELKRLRETYGATVNSPLKANMKTNLDLCTAYASGSPKCYIYAGCTGSAGNCFPYCVWASDQNISNPSPMKYGNFWLTDATDDWENDYDDIATWALSTRCVKTVAVDPATPEGVGDPGPGEAYVITTNANHLTGATKVVSVSLTETSGGSNPVKWLVSFDSRVTWVKMTGECLSEASSLTFASANTAAEIQNWVKGCNLPAGTLDFAMDLQTTDGTTLPSVDKVVINYYQEFRNENLFQGDKISDNRKWLDFRLPLNGILAKI